MKLLALLMTVIMLLTGFDLCMKDEATDSRESAEWVKTGNDKSLGSDVCSPFCNCTRCSFSILLPVPQDELKTFPTLVFRYPTGSIANQPGPGRSVWQPPRRS